MGTRTMHSFLTTRFIFLNIVPSSTYHTSFPSFSSIKFFHFKSFIQPQIHNYLSLASSSTTPNHQILEMDVPWSQLPPELLETISTKLTIFKDYLQFRAVCVSWRSSVPARPRHLPCQLPWLMLPSGLNSGNIRVFFNLSDKIFHRLELRETRRKRCCGSSHGWLVLIEQTPKIYLVNPITRERLKLPPITRFPNVLDFDCFRIGKEYLLENEMNGESYYRDLKAMCDVFIKKIVLSSSPVDEECIAVAILSETGELAFCRKGSSEWSMIDGGRSYCEDVVYHNGLLYAVSKKGGVAVFDIGGDSKIVTVIPPTTPDCGGDILYLVVSNGDLFLVARDLDIVGDIEPDLIYVTVGFGVFKLNASELNWEEVKSLGDRMFFLGGNSSLCLVASDFHGCKGNSIYFTDDHSEASDGGARGNHDVGIFSLEDGRIEALPCWPAHSRLIWPPHIWVTPSPC